MQTEKTNEAPPQNETSEPSSVRSTEMGRPRRKASIAVAGLMAMTAATAGPLMTPRRESEGPRELTDTDRWYLKRAEDRRARRLQKRIENQRRADAGKRPSDGSEPPLAARKGNE